jgi:hypothetical protein
VSVEDAAARLAAADARAADMARLIATTHRLECSVARLRAERDAAVARLEAVTAQRDQAESMLERRWLEDGRSAVRDARAGTAARGEAEAVRAPGSS